MAPGRTCALEELTPGFRALIEDVQRTLAAHRAGAAIVSLTCYGKPGDMLDVDIRPRNGDACPVRVQSALDGCYNQVRLQGCVFDNLGPDQVLAVVAAVCAGRVTVRRWARRGRPGQECRRDVTVRLHRGGSVRESLRTGWMLGGIRAPSRAFAPY